MDDNNNIWTYMENGNEHQVTETEYFWYLIRRIPLVLNTQDMERILYLLFDLEEFTAETTNLHWIEQINRFIPIVKNKIHNSNTSAERMLLWIENLGEEEQSENIEQQITGTTYLGSAAPAA